MSYRYGNEYLVLLYQESSYGQEISDFGGLTPIILADVLTPPQPQVEKLECKRRNLKRVQEADNILPGKSSYNLTLSGELCDTQSAVLAAFFGKSSFPYSVQESHTPYSYHIIQLFKDGNMHLSRGCVCNNLKITGESGGLIQYEAQFRCRDAILEFASSQYAHFPAYDTLFSALPNPVPMLFYNIKVGELFKTANGGYNEFNRFELNLKNNFVNDAASYTNNRLRNLELLTDTSGEFETEMNYESSKPIQGEWLWNPVEASFDLTGAARWTFSMRGVLSSVELPDPDKDMYRLSAKMTLARNEGQPAITITRDII